MASVPPLLLVGVAIICVGDLLHIIGLATPNWEELDASFTEVTTGLFKTCYDDNCDTIDNPSSDREAAQAMAIIGMLFGLLAGAMALLYVVLNLINKSAPKLMALVCAAASIAALIFIIICVIIYGAKIKSDISGVDLGYSFGLCITGAILLGIGGGLVFVGSKSVG